MGKGRLMDRRRGAAALAGRRAALVALLAVLLALVSLAGLAEAERAQVGNMVIYLNGGITPRVLPRHQLSPVAVDLRAGIQTADDSPIPRVQEIRLELAWRGALDTRGLPVCPRRRLESVDARAAMRDCGDALVGRGHIYSRIFLPGQQPFGLPARLLAFNGKTTGGAPALWVLAYAAKPPVSVLLPFYVRHQRGRFHTVLVGIIPRTVGPWPHFANFEIEVSRNFVYRGRTHSYLRAACPLPPHFTAGFLSLARASFIVEGAPPLRVETVRSCRAS